MATIVGLVLQIVMVLVGHVSEPVKGLFAFGGMGFSLIAGLVYAYKARAGWGSDIGGGTLAGAICALIGIAISVVLRDVPPSLLALGTVSSAVTGAIGGAAGKLAFRVA